MDIKQIADMKIVKVQTELPYPKNNKEKNEIVFLYATSLWGLMPALASRSMAY